MWFFNLIINVDSTPLKELPVGIKVAEWMLGMLWNKSLTAKKQSHKNTQQVSIPLQPDTAKNAQVATSVLTSCNNMLQHADIRMRLHG